MSGQQHPPATSKPGYALYLLHLRHSSSSNLQQSTACFSTSLCLQASIRSQVAIQLYGAIQVGTLMAGTDKFYIRVNGVGGHGGTPHLVKDTVVAASAIVMNLQPLVSRETDPAEGGIVGVTLINSGKLALLMLTWYPLFMLDTLR